MTEDPFLAAVLADPLDDAPRLIYADWLDEQDRSDRAEFIRVQCALAEHTPWKKRQRPCQCQRCRDLRTREEEYLKEAERMGQDGWTYDAGGEAYRILSHDVTWWRGFGHSVVLHPDQLLRYGDSLFQAQPIRIVHVRGLPEWSAELVGPGQTRRHYSLRWPERFIGGIRVPAGREWVTVKTRGRGGPTPEQIVRACLKAHWPQKRWWMFPRPQRTTAAQYMTGPATVNAGGRTLGETTAPPRVEFGHALTEEEARRLPSHVEALTDEELA